MPDPTRSELEDLALDIARDMEGAGNENLARAIADARVGVEVKNKRLPPGSYPLVVGHSDSPAFWGLVLAVSLADGSVNDIVTVTRLYCWRCGWRTWRHSSHCASCHEGQLQARAQATFDVMEASRK